MPDPPDVGLFTRFVLENPWPVGIALLVIAVLVVWRSLYEGQWRRVAVGLGLGLLGLIVIAIGWFVVTASEHGKQVTREFVEAVVAEDLVGADALLVPNTIVHLGSTRNIGHDLDRIRDGLSMLADRYSISSNSITHLRGYTESGDRATIHLACWTEVQAGYAPTPSQWVLVIERQPDGTWKITRITCLTIATRPPPAVW